MSKTAEQIGSPAAKHGTTGLIRSARTVRSLLTSTTLGFILVVVGVENMLFWRFMSFCWACVALASFYQGNFEIGLLSAILSELIISRIEARKK